MKKENDSIVPSDESFNQLLQSSAKKLGFEYEIPKPEVETEKDKERKKILEKIRKNKENSIAYQQMVKLNGMEEKIEEENDSIVPSDEFFNQLLQSSAKQLGFEYEIPKPEVETEKDKERKKVLDKIKKNKENSIAYQRMVKK